MQQNWQIILSDSVRTDEDLIREFDIPEEQHAELKRLVDRYPVCINSYYLGLIDKKDPDDPVRKMCVPDLREFSSRGSIDTSGEADNTVVTGMQHKYKQTAMILSTNQCAMYCRHCFRKRLVGTSGEEIGRQLPVMADYVKRHKEINNVLISGGDSLLNSNSLIRKYLEYFSGIGRLDFIRFGTRVPVVLPQRIYADEELISIFGEFNKKKQIMIVTQFNHPREITPEAIRAINELKSAGCIIRNQTVMLKGINDQPETLSELMNSLVGIGVIPYYIFQCRPVSGVANQFQVPIIQGIEVVNEARSLMNGQAKSARYAMSHPKGKIEILGSIPVHGVLFKFHQAKSEEDESRIFTSELSDTDTWLDEDLKGI